MNRTFTTTVGALLVTTALACGGNDTIVNAHDGVVVRVVHPARLSYHAQTRRQGDKTSADVSWGDGGTGQRAIFEVDGMRRLRVNDVDYGRLARGDNVVINGDKITVNGRPRSPFEGKQLIRPDQP